MSSDAMTMSSKTDSNPEIITLAEAVEKFCVDLSLAPRSIKTYRTGVAKLLQHLLKEYALDPQVTPVTALTEEHVISFARQILPQEVLSPEGASQLRTARNNIAAVRKFCTYLAANDIHPTLPTARLFQELSGLVPQDQHRFQEVKQTDLEKIVEYVNSMPEEDLPRKELRRLKVKAMILLLSRTGIRVSELCSLRVRDINLTEGSIQISSTRKRSTRTVYFDTETGEALSAYWKARSDPPLREAGSSPAISGRDIPGNPGSAISPRTVEHIVMSICKELGIESEITPHSFRHGLAHSMLGRNMRVTTVQTILGHKALQTTRQYIRAPANVVGEYQGAFGEYHAPRLSSQDRRKPSK